MSTFLGRGWSFPPTFSGATGGVAMTEDEEDIRRSLEILLSTRVGERFLQPKYGCDLDHLLFEPLDTGTATYTGEMIKQAILMFEPRIDVLTVDLGQPDDGEGHIDIVIEYRVRSTQSRYNLVYPFYL